MRVVATIEARMTSSRLPGKVLMDIEGKPMLSHVIQRAKRIKCVDQVVVATTTNKTDDQVVDLAEKMDAGVFRGSEDDVLVRVLEASRKNNADIIIEITGDMPLIDSTVVDEAYRFFIEGRYDYVSEISMKNSDKWNEKMTFPLGFGAEIYRAAILEETAMLTDDPKDHEHVTSYIINHPEKFRLGGLQAEGRFASVRRPDIHLAVNTQGDMDLVREIFKTVYKGNPQFTIFNVIEFLNKNPGVLELKND